jgi:very-short-patch-repair endonuclease
MQEITKKLHKKVMDEFYPMAEQLAKEGRDKGEIVAAFQKQLKLKTQQYYEKQHGITRVSEIFKTLNLKETADSKAESIFYGMLIKSGLKFEFQYAIGPYKADYLFAGYLVVELDGPQHDKDHDDKRDQYMRSMGYKIIRVPLWILVSCPEVVIEEIQEAIKGIRLVPNSKKK